jgi:NAD(P)-dependent dehydrogenase (short-subunit alcohol dehydrogenase family)
LEVDEATLDRLISLNIKAAFIVAQQAARLMAGGGAGVIVNMSSQMGHVGSERNRTAYVMTKHAIEGLTKAMAVELAPKGVRVVSIAPTFVMTPLTKPFFDDPETRQWILDRIPLGRAGTVEEVANAVVFLASPAAALVTGSSLLADGGWTAW